MEPASEALRVTEANGSTITSLNAAPAVEVFEEHAESTGQRFDRNDPIPFFLHNLLGIDTGSRYKLRVPLAVLEDGSIGCASDIPAGATVHIMRTTAQSAADAAMRAVDSAMNDMRGTQPEVAFFFDCVATRLRMGGEFGMEMDAAARAREGAVCRLQYVRPDRTVGKTVQQLPQLHGDGGAAAGGATRRPGSPARGGAGHGRRMRRRGVDPVAVK